MGYVKLTPENVRSAKRSYDGMSDLLYRESGKFIIGRKLQNNTYLERRPNGVALRLHQTDVLLWESGNTVTLNSGGWLTATTKDRMNSWLPIEENGRQARIWSDKGHWRVSFYRKPYGSDQSLLLDVPILDVPYHDGMVIDLNTLTEFSPSEDDSAYLKWNSSVDKCIEFWFKHLNLDKVRLDNSHAGWRQPVLPGAPAFNVHMFKNDLIAVLGAVNLGDALMPVDKEHFEDYGPEYPRWVRDFTYRVTGRRYPHQRRVVSAGKPFDNTQDLFEDFQERQFKFDFRQAMRQYLYQGPHSRTSKRAKAIFR